MHQVLGSMIPGTMFLCFLQCFLGALSCGKLDFASWIIKRDAAEIALILAWPVCDNTSINQWLSELTHSGGPCGMQATIPLGLAAAILCFPCIILATMVSHGD